MLECYSLPAPQPLNDGAIITDLREAMRAAGCVTHLTGASRELIALRAAAVAAVGSELSASNLAVQLGISKRSVQRLRARRPDPDLVHAIRIQLDLGVQ